MSHSHGFTTSIDLVRRQSHSTTLAGQKRPAGDTHPPSKLANTSANAHNGSVSDAYRLKASQIRSAAGTRTAAPAPAPQLQPEPQSQLEPEPGTQESLSNPVFNLPQSLTSNFAALGISTIYAWQASCLLSPGLLSGQRHLVYTAPTGGGKSLVADVLMLKRVIENPGRKAILVLPYVALVQEKLKWLRRVVAGVCVQEDDSGVARDIRVTGFFGGNRTSASWNDMDIAVCTIEKVCPVTRLPDYPTALLPYYLVLTAKPRNRDN